MNEKKPDDRDMKTFGEKAVIIVIALIAVSAVALFLLGQGPAGDSSGQGTITPVPTHRPDTPMTRVSTVPTSHQTPRPTSTTVVPTTSPSPVASPTVTPAPTFVGDKSFSFSVSPATAVAAPGDQITYHLTIEGLNGFSDPVQLSLHVSAVLVYNQDYDLGTQYPPYPKTVDYPFTVPGNVPHGITVNGLITARGGSIIRQQPLVLQVL